MKTFQSLKYSPSPIQRGYTDRILHVNLNSCTISISVVQSAFKEKYIGGRGYALKLIWDGTSGETRYDSEDNILVMASGPLCNEPMFPGTGKFIVATISPLTDTFIDSNIGGHFAPILKLCGFDALEISGISKEDAVLIVDGDEGFISIIEAPVFAEEIDQGSLSYGNALIKWFNKGKLNENIAAVTTGIGACHTRFGIINSIFYDKRRNRIRSKQAGRGGTGHIRRVWPE